MPVLLIRHAHAGARGDWDGEDVFRPLSRRGWCQARHLVAAVKAWPPRRILTSPYVRCQETVAPLAEALGIQPEASPALAEGHGADAVGLVRSLALEPVALCTHGDVIPEVLVALADEDRLDLGPRPRQAKGSVWVLAANSERFSTATYVPPAG